jgi:acyl-CoA synthetase (AMP-forming)/AMP-acid ligase II
MPLARNTFGMLDRIVKSHRRGDVALTLGDDHRTFETLHDRSLRLAAGLAGAGIGEGDKVAVLLGNGHEWPEVLFGLAALGAVCVPVNILLAPGEVEHMLNDCDARCLILEDRVKGLVAALSEPPELIVTVGEVDTTGAAKVIAYDKLMESSPGRFSGPGLDDLAILYYSSGTTGLPKAACHTHNGVLWNAFHQIPDLGLSPDDTYMVVPSFSWAAGFHDLVLSLIWLGGRSAMMPTGGTNPERVTAAIEAAGANRVMLVPTLLRQFLEAPAELERLRKSTLRWIVSGSEAVPRPVIEQVAAELPDCQVVQGYGMSEFPVVATVLRPEEALDHAGSAGRPTSITSLAIKTDAGEIAEEGEGEILLRSPATMREYYNRPQENEVVFEDGWFHTGDVGSVDADGYVTITGRKKDMIISGGLNVYPKEVEEILYRIDGIAEAAVVGVPDERWGEKAVAVVVGSAIDVAAINRECVAKLAGYKRPRAVLVREESLPRNPTGKVLKRELRPWAAQQVGAEAARN